MYFCPQGEHCKMTDIAKAIVLQYWVMIESCSWFLKQFYNARSKLIFLTNISDLSRKTILKYNHQSIVNFLLICTSIRDYTKHRIPIPSNTAKLVDGENRVISVQHFCRFLFHNWAVLDRNMPYTIFN